jgi:serine/threonine-protein kinase
MYELLVGRPPFIGDTPVSIAFQHVSAPLVSPSEINPELDKNLETIIKVALCKNPEDRYQDASAMLADLRLAIRGEPVTTKIKRIKSRKVPVIVASIGAVITILSIAAFTLSSPKPQEIPTVQIPNVIGLTEQAAKELLPNFTVNIQHEPNTSIPKGRVSAEFPLPTTKVLTGSSITLTISDGLGNATVPTNIVGLLLPDARSALSAAGLTIAQTIPVDSSEAPGTVLSINPSAGSILTAGSGVQLQISSGNLLVPNLVGATDVQAITTLTQAGFSVKTANAYDETQPLGIVLAQAPEEGATQPIGSSVTITVNTEVAP